MPFHGRNYFAVLLAAFALAGLLGSSAADAAAVSVNCPGTVATGDREFTVTTNPGTATCLAFGPGNVNGNGDAINLLDYITLDKSDDLHSGALPGSLIVTEPDCLWSGTFSINAPGYTDFVIAFKSGSGKLDPDWAAFALPEGVTSGSWSISGKQELSHANLYGRLIEPIPLPSAVWFLGSALSLLGWARRSRRPNADLAD